MPDYAELIERAERALAVSYGGTIHNGHTVVCKPDLRALLEAISTLLKERDDARRERDNAVANCVSAVKWLQGLGVDFSAATSA
jgi:hypothetical protein